MRDRKQLRIASLLLAVTVAVPCAGQAVIGADISALPRRIRYDGPIIDVHLHSNIRRDAAVNPVTGIAGAATPAQLLDSVLRECRAYRIVRAVVNGSLDSLQPWIAADPNRFIAAPMILQGGPASMLDFERLRAEFAGRTAKVMGEVTAQYSGLSPDDDSLKPYWKLAEELDVPVMVHMGTSFPRSANSGRPGFRLRLGDPLLLEDVLIRHPKLRLWVAHGGLPFEQEMFALLDQYPEVYMDVSVINWIGGPAGRPVFHAFLKRAIERGFGKRIMFGSDQMIWADAIGLAIEGVDSATFLTPGQKRDIFHDNAVKFFRLEEAAKR